MSKFTKWIFTNIQTPDGRKKVITVFLRALDYIAVSTVEGIGSFFSMLFNPKKRGPMFKNIVLLVLTLGIVASGVLLLWVVTLKIPDLQSFDQRLIGQ